MAAAGVTRDVDRPAAWELYSVNVVAQARGSGLADELLDAVLGVRDASVWVLADNERAQSLYRRHGFAADGRLGRHDGTGAEQLRMVRRSCPALT